MKRLYYLLGMLLVTSVWYGCKKEDRLDYIDPNAPAPAQVSSITSESLPGKVLLTFSVPQDPNLLYVKAVYELKPGEFKEAKSSFYADTLSLVGFGDTLEHEVKIYTVGRNEKASEPMTMTVKPGMPPVLSVYNDLKFAAGFGGVNIDITNPHGANIVIDLLEDTTGTGSWTVVEQFYTQAKTGRFSKRDYPPLERRFAVTVRDRWHNQSDTLVKMLTPLFEEEVPKPWKNMKFASDSWADIGGYAIEKMWDKAKTGEWSSFLSAATGVMPRWFTLDLGVRVTLSRMKYWHNLGSTYWAGAPKKWEIWGSNSPDDNWASWVLLGPAFNSFKPSGTPIGQWPEIDQTYARQTGEDHEFMTPPPAVRYIRFKLLQTYDGNSACAIDELAFFGQIVR